MDQKLRQSERLRNRSEFQWVLETPAIVGARIIIHARQREHPPSRLGLIVSRAIGTAVIRNRAKRRLRELFRRTKSRLTVPVDIVIRARQPIRGATYADLESEYLNLLTRRGLLQPPSGPPNP